MENLKILYVTREFPPSKRMGGIATYVSETSKYLARKGHEVFVIAASDDVHTSFKTIMDGVNITRLSGGDFHITKQSTVAERLMSYFRQLRYYLPYRRNLADIIDRMVREHEIDLVECAEYGNEAMYWIKRKNKIPTVIRLHGPTIIDRSTGVPASLLRSPLTWIFGKLELQTLRSADWITSPSNAMATKITDLMHRKVSIEVIPNAIDINRWNLSANNKSLVHEKKGEEVEIFSAGTVVKMKGHADLVKAVQLLRSRGHKATLKIAGRHGKLGRSLLSRQAERQQLNWLTLPGQMSRKWLVTEYANADIAVFPSWWESFGIVCIEAMAAGGIVLGSTEGGMAEIIDDGIDGFLVKPRDPVLIASRMIEILGLSPGEKIRIRERAKIKAKQFFSIDTVMNKQIVYYRRVINNYKNFN